MFHVIRCQGYRYEVGTSWVSPGDLGALLLGDLPGHLAALLLGDLPGHLVTLLLGNLVALLSGDLGGDLKSLILTFGHKKSLAGIYEATQNV